jgi:photosystem II stability/assembly factor-like uncharacterized protein
MPGGTIDFVISRTRLTLAILFALTVVQATGAQHWDVQFYHDELRSEMRIVDIQFPSASRGIAVGYRYENKQQYGQFRIQPGKGFALVTADGGARWQETQIKALPRSVFFLNDSVGWMVASDSLWKTNESGKEWQKVAKLKYDIERVYFLDELHGWGVGFAAALETSDGGKSWKPIRVSPVLPGDPNRTNFPWVTFANPREGLMIGNNDPRNTFGDLSGRSGIRETPHLNFILQTLDGGGLWRTASLSMFGNFTRLKLSPRGKSIGLIEHAETFEVPSEVVGQDSPDEKLHLVFKDPKFFVSDVWVSPDGTYYMAGIALASRLRSVIPQRVRVAKSRDLKTWTSIPVDYRAVANRVSIAGSDEDNVWLATNNGMILKLNP